MFPPPVSTSGRDWLGLTARQGAGDLYGGVVVVVRVSGMDRAGRSRLGQDWVFLGLLIYLGFGSGCHVLFILDPCRPLGVSGVALEVYSPTFRWFPFPFPRF